MTASGNRGRHSSVVDPLRNSASTVSQRPSYRDEDGFSKIRYKSKRTLSPVSQILATFLRRSGLGHKLAKYQFIEFWPQIVGKAIAERAKPEAIRNGVLVVRVESSTWAQELTFQKTIIQKRLNNFLGAEQAVKDIQFYVSGRDQLANRRK